jgi:hypothetical protein
VNRSAGDRQRLIVQRMHGLTSLYKMEVLGIRITPEAMTKQKDKDKESNTNVRSVKED